MIELPWIAIFVLGAPWFWLLFIIASCLIIWALENDNGIWATSVVVLFAVIMVLFGPGWQGLNWIANNPTSVFWWALGYVVIGACWGVVKWYFYVLEKIEQLENKKIKWLQEHGVNEKKVPLELRDAWTKYVCDSTDFGHWEYLNDKGQYETSRLYNSTNKKKRAVLDKPRSWNNKARIVRWMNYWPFSMIWTILDDIVKKIFQRIQKWLGNLMDGITNFVWRNADEDFGIQESEKVEKNND